MNRSTRGQGGFTLIEVILAFSIAAVSVTVLLQALARNLANTAVVHEYAAATRLARSLLARQGNDITIAEGHLSGRFDDKFGWIRSVRPYQTDRENRVGLHPYWIEITVHWASGSGTRSVTVNNLRLVSGTLPDA